MHLSFDPVKISLGHMDWQSWRHCPKIGSVVTVGSCYTTHRQKLISFHLQAARELPALQTFQQKETGIPAKGNEKVIGIKRGISSNATEGDGMSLNTGTALLS